MSTQIPTSEQIMRDTMNHLSRHSFLDNILEKESRFDHIDCLSYLSTVLRTRQTRRPGESLGIRMQLITRLSQAMPPVAAQL